MTSKLRSHSFFCFLNCRLNPPNTRRNSFSLDRVSLSVLGIRLRYFFAAVIGSAHESRYWTTKHSVEAADTIINSVVAISKTILNWIKPVLTHVVRNTSSSHRALTRSIKVYPTQNTFLVTSYHLQGHWDTHALNIWHINTPLISLA